MDVWKKHKGVVKRYPRDRQEEFLRGEVRTPIEEVGLTLAWGEPDYAWKTGGGCRALLYSTDHNRLFETCGANVVADYAVDVPLDCERLDAVVPRIEKKMGRFRDLERAQQLELLGGIPETWMDKKDLEIAFGDPYKKRGDTWLFHDDSGIVEGPIITLDSGGQVGAVDWPTNPQMTKKGKKTVRKAEAAERRAELDAYRREQAAQARKQARRQILSALAVTAVVATAAVIADEAGAFDQPAPSPAPSPSPRPMPAPSTVVDGRNTTTTSHSEENGVPVTTNRTVVDTTPEIRSGRFPKVGFCQMPFQAIVVLTIKGNSFSATGETLILASGEEPIPASPIRGTIERSGRHDVVFPGLAVGTVDDTGYLDLKLTS